MRADTHGAACRHGADIHAISKELGTRTTTQVRTHIQKYHLKLVRGTADSRMCARGMGLPVRQMPSAADSVTECFCATTDHSAIPPQQIRDLQAKKKATLAAKAAAEQTAAQAEAPGGEK